MDKLVADIIVESLQSAGAKHCYGVAGDTLNLIARSLDKSELEWVLMRHEEAGALPAQAEAQVADRLTAVAGRPRLRWSAFHQRLARPGRTRLGDSDGKGQFPLIKVAFPERGGGNLVNFLHCVNVAKYCYHGWIEIAQIA